VPGPANKKAWGVQFHGRNGLGQSDGWERGWKSRRSRVKSAREVSWKGRASVEGVRWCGGAAVRWCGGAGVRCEVAS
jgi:hypothetical protein